MSEFAFRHNKCEFESLMTPRDGAMRNLIWMLLIVAVGCGDCTDNAGDNSDPCTGADCPDGGNPLNSFVTDGGNNPNSNANGFVELRLDPPDATLIAADGTTPVQDFTVIGIREDGTEGTYRGASFEIDNETIGQIDAASGTFTANGIVGGTATVTASGTEPGVAPATGTITVKIERTVIGPNAPGDADMLFGSPQTDDTQAASIVYPLEGAVMPQNLYPADIQWLNGADGDVFRITMTKPNASIVAYVLHSGAGFGNHWLVDIDAWRSIAQSDPDADATIVVDRWVAASQTAYTTAPVNVRFARAALSGTVYYWDIAAGRIIRIDDGTGQGVAFMPTPPPDAGGTQCVGCHSVSNSGQYMVGRLGGGDNVGTVFDLTIDLSGNPPPTVWGVDAVGGPRWWFSTWNPADDRIMVTRAEPNGGLELMDPFTGMSVAPAAGALPTDHVTQPSWAPDDSLIAYVSNTGNWGGEMMSGDLSVIPVTGPDSFGTPQVLLAGDIPGASPAGTSTSYPTWTPDAGRIAFAHGSGARSERDLSALYIVDRDGQNPIRLTRANGGPDTTNNYQPNFSPFDQGGYFWLMFLSRRDYGNGEVGTLGTARQQLWVTAIKKDAQPGDDPSEVAYWLPGQNTQSLNISGYWAPRPCRDDGSDCSVGTECCSGTCAPDPTGALVCSPPPPESCRELFETCSTTADCCEGKDLVCIDNVCQKVVN